VVDTWFEFRDYVTRSIEFVQRIFNYSKNDLLELHEIDFFSVLARAEDYQRKQIKQKNNG
jgi:hypothetical protein